MNVFLHKKLRKAKIKTSKGKKIILQCRDADAELSKWPIKTCVCNKGKKEAYSEPCQTSKMELFVKIVDGGCQLAKFAKSSILDV